jgi:hypothetical protein
MINTERNRALLAQVAKASTAVSPSTAIGSPRRPRPGMVQQAGARSTRCLVAPDATRARTDFCYLTRSFAPQVRFGVSHLHLCQTSCHGPCHGPCHRLLSQEGLR